MKSIRTFLIVALIATITLVNVLTSVRGYSESMTEANKIFDNHLLSYANLLDAIPWRAMSQQQLSNTVSQMNDNMLMQSDSIITYLVWEDDTIYLSNSNFTSFDVQQLLEPGFHSINFEGYRWRSLYLYNPISGLKILVAERDDQRFLVSEKIVLELILPVIIVLPVIALLIWLIIGVGLSPVKRLAAKFRTKQATDLSAIELSDVPKELTLLATSANDLLLRLEQSFEREKRFAADAAHELRTPITALKLHIGNLITETSDQCRATELLKLSIDRMGHLVEQILVLNSTSPDHYMANFVELDLANISQKIISQQYDKLEQNNIGIILKCDNCRLIADQFGIETLLENLLGNAIKYTEKNGQIEVELLKNKDSVTIIVMDSGPGIAATERERVFERFYRVKGDRHNSSVSGCGLGLAIVKRIAELHQATIELTDSDFATGIKVTVSIPIRIS